MSSRDLAPNPIAEQGGVYANAAYNIGAKISIRNQNEKMGVSLYEGASNEHNWDIEPSQLLFSVNNVNGASGDTRMQVLPALNGLGAEVSAMYPNNPEMVRQAVKNQVQYVGVAHQSLSSARGQVERGIAVQIGGLHTIRVGGGKFGDETPEDSDIRPGDILVADVPTPGPQGRCKNGLSRGTLGSKYCLQARKASHKSAAQAFHTHVLEYLRNPKKWRHAMGEMQWGTGAWEAAVKNILTSYRFAATMGVRAALKSGSLGPADAGEIFSQNDLNNDDAIVLAFAKALGLVGDANTRSAAQASFAFDLDRAIFHDPADIASEVGVRIGANNIVIAAGRANDARQTVLANSDQGKLVLVQFDHFRAAVSAFHHAVQSELRNVIGKATTGTNEAGSGKVHVYLGLNGA